MSAYNLDILAFIEIVKSGYIPLEQWADLLSFAEEMPNDPEDLYAAIDQWLQGSDRQPIRAKWKEFTQNLDAGLSATGGAISNEPTTMGAGGSKPQADPVKAAEDPALRDQLKNEIINHKPLNFPNLDPANQPPKAK